MNLTENFQISSFSPFRKFGKRSLLNDFDLISRSFDENVLARLKSLNSASDPPSISLSWLSRAVDFLNFTHIEARALISKLRSSYASSDDSLVSYLDDSVKLMDVCNSISSEIERLRQRRLLMNFILHLLEFPADGSQALAPEKLKRARDSLSGWENNVRGAVKRRGFQTRDPESLIRDLAAGLENAPRGKISSAEKLARRTLLAVGLVTVFVAGTVVSALHELPEIVRIRVPDDFIWSDALNSLESAISAELKRRVIEKEKRGFLDELDDVDTRVRAVCDAINDVEDQDKNQNKTKKLGAAVKELETATEKFSKNLDSLFNGVNEVFDAVLCTRNSMLESFRVGLEKRPK